MSKVYLDPKGNMISLKQFIALRDVTPDPWLISQYENDKLRVLLRGLRQTEVDGIPKNLWKMFVVVAENIISEDPYGEKYPTPRYVVDPDASRLYRTLGAATDAYKALLRDYTLCQIDKTGELIEVGNKFSKDLPVVDATVAEPSLFGSW